MKREYVIRKLHNIKGESIGETLVSLLISALALTMLAGAIGTSSNLVTKSSNKMSNYYDANEYLVIDDTEKAEAVKNLQTGDYTGGEDGTVSLVEVDGNINSASYTVKYYKNTVLGTDDDAVIFYEKKSE